MDVALEVSVRQSSRDVKYNNYMKKLSRSYLYIWLFKPWSVGCMWTQNRKRSKTVFRAFCDLELEQRKKYARTNKDQRGRKRESQEL